MYKCSTCCYFLLCRLPEKCTETSEICDCYTVREDEEDDDRDDEDNDNSGNNDNNSKEENE